MKETLNFVNYPLKQRTIWEQMSENCPTICFYFLCRNNLCTETEQNNENMSCYFGVIDKIMWYSYSEQPVPFFFQGKTPQVFSHSKWLKAVLHHHTSHIMSSRECEEILTSMYYIHWGQNLLTLLLWNHNKWCVMV